VVEGIVVLKSEALLIMQNTKRKMLCSAAKLIVAVNEVITSHDGRQVGTVGKISAAPGAYNVVPGKVVLD
jgi:N-carbamoyl-L-amino-acid hydrolase